MRPLKTITFKLKQKQTKLFRLFLSVAILSFSSIFAQVQNNGTIYVSNGSSFYVASGIFNFGTGSVTQTGRGTNGSNYGKIILSSDGTSQSAAPSAFVDGYVTNKLGTSYLPSGQTGVSLNTWYTNATVVNGVTGAYYRAAPTNAANLDASVQALSGVEYWDIEGDNATITLYWKSTSNISTITSSIANLTIAGYNSATNKWVAIASGTPSGTLTAGYISSTSSLALGTYSSYTLAVKGITCADLVASSGLTSTYNGGWNVTPTLADAAVIAGTYPITAGSFQCNSLTVNAPMALTDGQTVEVVNGISGTSSITMSSQASVMQRNDASTIAVPIVLTKKTRTGMYAYDYTYLGSPLKLDALAQVNLATAYTANSNTVSGTAGAFDSLYKYVSGDVSTTGGWQALSATAPGIGFIARIKAQAPFATANVQNMTNQIGITYSGTTNNGLVTVPIANVVATPTSARNNNLLANPYPSAIDADKFLEYNTNLDGVVYLWKSVTPNTGLAGAAYSAADYIAYTRAGSTAESGISATVFNGKIASGQGFLVKSQTSTGTGTAFFNNCMRISGNNTQFMRTATDAVVDRYKLNLLGANQSGNQILVAYMPETTLAYDRMYDAELNSVSSAQVYSILDNSNIQLGINARPVFENTDIVTIGVSKTSANVENFSVTISEKEGIFATNAVNVFLHDRLLNVYHNLANGAYNFASDSVELNNRFQVVYQDGTLNNPDFESNNVIATINKETLKIVASLPMTDVAIYDISGRLVIDVKGNNQVEVTNAFRFAEGIYIAKIKLNNGVITTQKLINKK